MKAAITTLLLALAPSLVVASMTCDALKAPQNQHPLPRGTALSHTIGKDKAGQQACIQLCERQNPGRSGFALCLHKDNTDHGDCWYYQGHTFNKGNAGGEHKSGICRVTAPAQCPAGTQATQQATYNMNQVCTPCGETEYSNAETDFECVEKLGKRFMPVAAVPEDTTTTCAEVCPFGYEQQGPSNWFFCDVLTCVRPAQPAQVGGTRCLDDSHQFVKSHSKTKDNRCVATTACEPGQFFASKDTRRLGIDDKQCEPCPVNHYSKTQQQANAAACILVQTCEPGMFVSVTPTPTNDRQCQECGTGSFSTEFNSDTCAPHRTEPCEPGTIITSSPSPTTDQVCTACGAGGYSTGSTSTICQQYSTCRKGNLTTEFNGERMTEDATPYSNRECKACPYGTYQNEENSEKCIDDLRFTGFEGSWHKVGSNIQLTLSTENAAMAGSMRSAVVGVTDGFADEAERAQERSVSLTLGNQATVTDEHGQVDTSESCTETGRDVTGDVSGTISVTAGYSSGAAPGGSVEGTVEGSISRSEVNSETTNECANTDKTVTATATDAFQKEEVKEDNLSFMTTTAATFEKQLMETVEASESTTETNSATVEVKCGQEGYGNNIYRWEIKGTRPDGGSKTVKTNQFICVGDRNVEPKCPPQKCGNAECTCCKDDDWAPSWFKGVDVCECRMDNDSALRDALFSQLQIETCSGAVAAGFCDPEDPESPSDIALAYTTRNACSCSCKQLDDHNAAAAAQRLAAQAAIDEQAAKEKADADKDSAATTYATGTTTDGIDNDYEGDYEGDYDSYGHGGDGAATKASSGSTPPGTVVGILSAVAIAAAVVVVVVLKVRQRRAAETLNGKARSAPTLSGTGSNPTPTVSSTAGDATVVQIEPVLALTN